MDNDLAPHSSHHGFTTAHGNGHGEGSRASEAVLRLSERDIRRHARARGPRAPIGWILVRQAYSETRLRLARQIRFRHRDNSKACDAYCAMRPDEFERVNARQAWANWRTIPRNLDGVLPTWPVTIVDLCCGTGQSTAVLAWYAAAGSRVLGLEYNPRFVDLARSRSYLGARGDAGDAVDVRFNAQSVLDTFRDADRAPLADRSIDLVNASGSVGCHFDTAATRILADEIDRVLKPRGLAMIDTGEAGTDAGTLSAIFVEKGFNVVHSAKSHPWDRYRQVCLRKA